MSSSRRCSRGRASGSYALNSLLATDYAPVQGYVLLMACVYVVINTLIDIIYALVDPRVRIQ